MYTVSSDFHAAVLAGAEQRAVLRFSDAVLSGNDIPVNGGLRLTEPFCAQDDLTIGLCPSASLAVTLANVGGMLDEFTFGEFKAYLGVKIDSDTYTPVVGAAATLPLDESNTVSIFSTTPYVKINGTAAANQPSFVPQAIMALDHFLYVISSAGAYFRYSLFWDGGTWAELAEGTWADQAVNTWDSYANLFAGGVSVTTNALMIAKGVSYAAAHRAVVLHDNIMNEYATDGTYKTYEMCPLGVFHADRPATVRKERVAFTAYDNMDKMDVDVTDWFAALTYPITLGEIFAGLCARVGITTTTTTFLNSTQSYATAPFASTSLTGRKLLKYIAEAACSIARFDREGSLELAWFGTNSQTIAESIETAVAIAEYAVAPIDKLQVQTETTDIGVVVGTGTNAYVLLASPLITGNNDTEIRAFATPIYDRMAAFSTFLPISVSVVGDWSYQAGDIADVVINGDTYSLPIFTQVVAWNGACKSTLSSTGSALRDVNAVTNREVFETNQKRTLLEKTVDGVSVTVSTKSATFAQDSVPTSTAIGDTWIDTNDNNKLYRAASVGADAIAVGEWVLYEIASGYVKTSHVEIAADHISLDSGGAFNVTAPTTMSITAGSGSSAVGMKNDTYFLYAGNADPALAPFSVKMDGTTKLTKLDAASGTFTDLSALFTSGQRIYIGEQVKGGENITGLFFSTGDDMYIGEDTVGVFRLKNISSGFRFYGDTPVTMDASLYVGTNCSAASFTDRTPDYQGDALAALRPVKSDKKGNIDHATLPEAARKKIKRHARDAEGEVTEVIEEDGRDLGMMISILTKGIQQLTEIVTNQQKQIDKLVKDARK